MIAGARYGHTNLIANDWRAVSGFHQEQFGCTPVPPERDFKGRDLGRGTGIPGAELRGVHLRLPGHGDEGPAFEIVPAATFIGCDGRSTGGPPGARTAAPPPLTAPP